jgi:prevent-host-death family protein
MRTVGIFEAKTHLSALLRAVARGERIRISARGKPIAELVPLDAGAATDAIDRLLANDAPLGMPAREAIRAGRL